MQQQTIYLNQDLKEQLRYKAYIDNTSQNKIVTEALKHYLADVKPETKQ